MSKNYEKVLAFYKNKLWDITKVKNAVLKGWITEEEYYSITGERYS